MNNKESMVKINKFPLICHNVLCYVLLSATSITWQTVGKSCPKFQSKPDVYLAVGVQMSLLCL